MNLPRWLRDWHVYTVAFLILLGAAIFLMLALSTALPDPTDIQLPTL